MTLYGVEMSAKIVEEKSKKQLRFLESFREKIHILKSCYWHSYIEINERTFDMLERIQKANDIKNLKEKNCRSLHRRSANFL